MIIYGKNPVVEAIRNKRNISKMVVLEGLKDQNFLKLLKENRIKYELLPQHIFSKRYGDKTGGIVAEINEYKYATLEQVLNKTSKKPEGGVLMILDGLEDPHNLGAILRSADATGADAIIIPKNRSVSLNQTVAKVSTGAIEYVDGRLHLLSSVRSSVSTRKAFVKDKLQIIGAHYCDDVQFLDVNHRNKFTFRFLRKT